MRVALDYHSARDRLIEESYDAAITDHTICGITEEFWEHSVEGLPVIFEYGMTWGETELEQWMVPRVCTKEVDND